jgi:hypothetical protein
MYTELKYIKTTIPKEETILRCKIEDVLSFVSLDPANSDYAEIMRQVDAGELTIEPADE